MIIFALKSLLILLLFHLDRIFNLEIDLKLIRIAKSFTSSKNYIDNDFFYVIPIFIGTDPQNLEVLYETNFTHLFINPDPKTMSNNFNSSCSSTLHQTPTLYTLDDFRGAEVNDVLMFSLNQFRTPWIYGYSAPNRYLIFDGVLGFGHQYTNDNEEHGQFGKRFNLLEQLYQLNKIPKRLFGHKYFNDNKYLRLYIGEINSDEYLNNQNYPKCSGQGRQIELKHKWNCLLKEITISSGMKLNITGHVYFSTGSNTITGPNLTGGDLIEEIIKDQGSNCNKYFVSNIKTSFRCTSAIDIFSFPIITFRLNGVDLSLHPQNLVYKEYNVRGDGFIYKSRLELDSNERYWSLGQPILRGLSMVFNEEDGTIGFWNLHYDRNYTREIWVIFGVSVIVAGIFLFAILLKIKQRDDKLNNNGTLLNKKNILKKEIDLPSIFI